MRGCNEGDWCTYSIYVCLSSYSKTRSTCLAFFISNGHNSPSLEQWSPTHISLCAVFQHKTFARAALFLPLITTMSPHVLRASMVQFPWAISWCWCCRAARNENVPVTLIMKTFAFLVIIFCPIYHSFFISVFSSHFGILLFCLPRTKTQIHIKWSRVFELDSYFCWQSRPNFFYTICEANQIK